MHSLRHPTINVILEHQKKNVIGERKKKQRHCGLWKDYFWIAKLISEKMLRFSCNSILLYFIYIFLRHVYSTGRTLRKNYASTSLLCKAIFRNISRSRRITNLARRYWLLSCGVPIPLKNASTNGISSFRRNSCSMCTTHVSVCDINLIKLI